MTWSPMSLAWVSGVAPASERRGMMALVRRQLRALGSRATMLSVSSNTTPIVRLLPRNARRPLRGCRAAGLMDSLNGATDSRRLTAGRRSPKSGRRFILSPPDRVDDEMVSRMWSGFDRGIKHTLSRLKSTQRALSAATACEGRGLRVHRRRPSALAVSPALVTNVTSGATASEAAVCAICLTSGRASFIRWGLLSSQGSAAQSEGCGYRSVVRPSIPPSEVTSARTTCYREVRSPTAW